MQKKKQKTKKQIYVVKEYTWYNYKTGLLLISVFEFNQGAMVIL